VNVSSLDEASRPRRVSVDPRPPTALGQAGQQALVAIHDQLRQELAQLLEALEQLRAGAVDPRAMRSLVNRMTMRQNYWSVGAFCATYCRILTLHHTIEDQRLFRDLGEHDASLAPVLERLSEEHEVIAEVLERLDRSLVAMVDDAAHLESVRRDAVALQEVLLSHLAYEEDELLPAIGTSSILL
jgi:hemerythrin-like domain-containing protein